MAINTDFYIKVEDETFQEIHFAYNLVSSDNTAIKVDGSNLPKRDSFGRKVATDIERFCLGSNIINPMRSSQRYISTYGSLFTSIFQETKPNIPNAIFNNHNGNNLCNFLIIQRRANNWGFFKAFEFFLFKKEFPEKSDKHKLQSYKTQKSVIEFLWFHRNTWLDYETKRLF